MSTSAQTSESHIKGAKLAEGKTKIIFEDSADPHGVIVESKDDITAGDGAKHDIIPNKAVLATQTTCNVFRLLKAAGVPVAFNRQVDEKSFSSPRVEMIPLEVVARREAHGSYLKRFPHISKGTIFPWLVFEFFLKTKEKNWNGKKLPCDDPHAVYLPHKAGFELYDVKKQFVGQEPFRFVPETEVFPNGLVTARVEKIEEITRKVFLILEKAWQLQGRRLVDFKIEFGLSDMEQLFVADVIDNDSWRLVKDGAYEDKQVYRDGGDLSEVAVNYRRIADLTDRFGLPRQCVVIWRGSEKDDHADFVKAGIDILGDQVAQSNLRLITCSMHKEPTRGLLVLRSLEQDVPDCVVIAFIGMSNGAGPTLSAHTTLPVINCSPTVKNFSDDIWASLRMPRDVPCMTVLSPRNALHAACNILSARNPALYAQLRYRMEERFENSAFI